MLLSSAIASLAIVWSIRHDVSYAFVSAPPREVGDLAAWDGSDGGYVRATGRVSAARAIRYDRLFSTGSFRLCPILREGEGEAVWVELTLPEGVDTARFIPPDHFEGRLVPFEQAGPRYRGLAGAVQRETGRTIGPRAWLLISEGAPSAVQWAPLLALLMTLLATWNVVALAKLARRVR
jgi:hypothetical protein